MVDLFDEVDEELRSDRYLSLFRRIAPWVTGVFAAVLVGFLGFWGYTTWQDRNLTTAALAYQKAVDALGTGDSKAALDGFEATRKAGAPGYKTLALMQEANLRVELNKPDEAAKLYDQAADSAPNQILGDLARLKAAEALLETATLPQLTARLTPLTDVKRPYAPFAREALAMAKLLAGKNDDARRDFKNLEITLGAPEDMRQRAEVAVSLIDDGEIGAAVAGAKAAATMPPPPAAMVGPPPSAIQGPPPQGVPGPGAAPTPPAGAAQ